MVFFKFIMCYKLPEAIPKVILSQSILENILNFLTRFFDLFRRYFVNDKSIPMLFHPLQLISSKRLSGLNMSW